MKQTCLDPGLAIPKPAHPHQDYPVIAPGETGLVIVLDLSKKKFLEGIFHAVRQLPAINMSGLRRILVRLQGTKRHA